LLDAQLLVAQALGADRLRLFMEPNREMTEAELAACREFVRRRGALREPVAYIAGKKEFLGLDFQVTRDTLVPRPETELLVEVALEFLRSLGGANDAPARRPKRKGMYDHMADAARKKAVAALEEAEAARGKGNADEEAIAEAKAAIAALDEMQGVAPAGAAGASDAANGSVGADAPPRFLDVGAGAGVVGIALAKLLPAARGWAVDCSPGALAIARANAAKHGVSERLAFLAGDVYRFETSNGQALPQAGELDLIVSNPPYVTEAEYETLAPEVKNEPLVALVSGADGLDVVRRLVDGAPALIKPGGMLAMEIGCGQGDTVKVLFERAGCWDAIDVKKDLAGLDRVATARRRA
jgi:release factor glutamine methyltransferase